MSAEWRSNLGAFLGATERQIVAGLIATAEVYRTEMVQQLQDGFTSGDFVTGNLANSVARGEPEITPAGASIAIGSTQVEPPYGLYWEVGHQNVFTGQFERVEKWVPTMVRMRDQLAGIFAAEVRAVDRGL